jgi:hypothetical protein
MRTPTALCLLLSLTAGPSPAQVMAPAGGWRVDPAVQRERDATRKSILDDELASQAKLYLDAHAELREARAQRLPRAKAEDIVERLDLHRRNIAELGREIARTVGDVTGSRGSKREVERVTDNWLISGQANSPGGLDSPPRPLPREPTPARNPEERPRPEWIIPANPPGRIP